MECFFTFYYQDIVVIAQKGLLNWKFWYKEKTFPRKFYRNFNFQPDPSGKLKILDEMMMLPKTFKMIKVPQG